MKKLFFTALILVRLFAVVSLAAVSSSSYKITTAIMSGGSLRGESASYRLRGEVREYFPGAFLKTAYFAERPILAPLITKVEPDTAVNTAAVKVAISGANFLAGASVKLIKKDQPEISGADITVVSADKITCTFDITGAAGGLWDVTVINPDGRSGTLPSAFKIGYPAPTITSIVPDHGYNNETVSVTLSGSYFRGGPAVKLSKIGEQDIIGDKVAVESSSKIACRFDLTGKSAGLWDVTVANDDGQSGRLPNGFKIEAPSLAIVGEVQVTPSPFKPGVETTTIKYTLSKDAEVTLYVFNIRGERVWQWTAPPGAEGGKAGLNQVIWDGITAFKAVASTGVYLYHITAKVDGEVKILARGKIAAIR